MKYTLLIFSLLLFIPVFSQPEMDAGNMPELGDRFTYHMYSPTSITPGDGGENQNWEFTSLPSDASIEIVVGDASSNPHGSNFPNAEFVITNNYFGARGLGTPNKNFHFYRKENNQLIKVGRADENSSLLWINQFGDEEVQVQYPITYNVTHSDEWNGGFISLGLQIDWNHALTEYTADGYGTLTLHGKEIPDVLRVKRERSYNSTIFGGQAWFKTMYEYRAKGFPFPLMTMVRGTVNGAGEAFEVYYIDAAHLQTVGVENAATSEWSAQFYPNPAVNQTKLELTLIKNEHVRVAIQDVTGKTLAMPVDADVVAGVFRKNIDLSQLSNGLYLISVRVGDQQIVERLFVQQP